MFLYKVTLVGDFGVGKTSLIHRFIDNTFSEDYISTIGVSISKKQLETANKKSTMMIWDIEGSTEHKPIFKQYLLGAKGFIIVADLTREKTIDSIAEHVKLCEGLTPNIPISIALNKSDIKTVVYDTKKIKALSANIINVFETSAKSGNTVNTIFDELNSEIIERN